MLLVLREVLAGVFEGDDSEVSSEDLGGGRWGVFAGLIVEFLSVGVHVGLFNMGDKL